MVEQDYYKLNKHIKKFQWSMLAPLEYALILGLSQPSNVINEDGWLLQREILTGRSKSGGYSRPWFRSARENAPKYLAALVKKGIIERKHTKSRKGKLWKYRIKVDLEVYDFLIDRFIKYDIFLATARYEYSVDVENISSGNPSFLAHFQESHYITKQMAPLVKKRILEDVAHLRGEGRNSLEEVNRQYLADLADKYISHYKQVLLYERMLKESGIEPEKLLKARRMQKNQ